MGQLLWDYCTFGAEIFGSKTLGSEIFGPDFTVKVKFDFIDVYATGFFLFFGRNCMVNKKILKEIGPK